MKIELLTRNIHPSLDHLPFDALQNWLICNDTLLTFEVHNPLTLDALEIKHDFNNPKAWEIFLRGGFPLSEADRIVLANDHIAGTETRWELLSNRGLLND